MTASSQNPRRVFRLGEVTGRIKQILLEASRKQIWVRAHLVVGKKGGVKSGHFYCELVEMDDAGRQVARIEAMIWRDDYDPLCRRLKAQGYPEALAGNQEVNALCSLSYHEVYGLRLQLHDVDPSLGEAHLEQNRRLILETLQKDGLLDRNKAVQLPAPALRIGLITAPGSAAFNDFWKTLQASPYAFQVLLAAAAMQGDMTEAQVLSGMRRFSGARVDLICIVRGGGSQIDLASFDSENIARQIANSPVPVFVGIGHEIDVCVLDFAAHTSFKTPTAVAEDLVRRVRELDERLAIGFDRLRSSTERRLALTTVDLSRRLEGLQQGSRKHLTLRESNHENNVLRMKGSFERVFSKATNNLDQAALKVRERAPRLIAEGNSMVQNAESTLKSTVRRILEARQESLQRNRAGLVQGVRKLHVDKCHHLESRLAMAGSKIERLTNTKERVVQALAAKLTAVTNQRIKDAFAALEGTKTALTARCERVLAKTGGALETRVSAFRLARYEYRLTQAIEAVQSKERHLRALGPESILRRGYAIVRDRDGTIVRSIEGCEVGQPISTTLADGTVESIVTTKEKQSDG